MLSLNAEGDLVFVFSQAGMLPETRATFFAQPFFRVDSTKVLSDALCAALGATSLVVQAGLYPITATDEGYTVAFPQMAFNVFYLSIFSVFTSPVGVTMINSFSTCVLVGGMRSLMVHRSTRL